MGNLKGKAYLVESVRRAWLMDIINMYGLLFVLPYYILVGYGMIEILVYTLVLILVGSYVLLKMSIRLTLGFKAEMLKDIERKNIMHLAYRAFYGAVIPQISLIFIPIMITATMAIGLIEISIYFKIAIIFLILFAFIVVFTYRNVRVVSANIHKILEYLKSA